MNKGIYIYDAGESLPHPRGTGDGEFEVEVGDRALLVVAPETMVNAFAEQAVAVMRASFDIGPPVYGEDPTQADLTITSAEMSQDDLLGAARHIVTKLQPEQVAELMGKCAVRLADYCAAWRNLAALEHAAANPQPEHDPAKVAAALQEAWAAVKQ